MRGYLIFGDINTLDHDIYVSAGKTFKSASREYETVKIPGRDGELIVKNDRYDDYEIEYPAFTFGVSREEFRKRVGDIRNAMGSQTGYQKLWDSYDPELYRLAFFKGGVEPDAASFLKAGTFSLKFQCHPHRYLRGGDEEVEYSSNGFINNPTNFVAKPLIRVVGHGTLGVGDYNVTIQGDSGTITYIDCDVMEAYGIINGAKISRNGYVTTGSNFPALPPGKSGVALGTGISAVTITPRWWTL